MGMAMGELFAAPLEMDKVSNVGSVAAGNFYC